MKAITPIIILMTILTVVEAQPLKNLDKYGGYKAISTQATGFFYLKKLEGRYWLITPEGNAFFSLGLNHINTYQDDVYDHLQNFQKDAKAGKKILEDLKEWNMNSLGYGSPEYLHTSVPFVQNVSFLSNGHYKSLNDFRFDDVFSKEFTEQVVDKIKDVCNKYRGNPYLIGYYFTDTPRWDTGISRERHGQDWVSYIKNQNAEAAGKQRYIAFLKDKYKKIDYFNDVYGLDYRSFEQLLNARFDHFDNKRAQIIEDDQEFLSIIAERHYSLVANTFREHDSDHLLLGDKYIALDHPDNVLKIAAKYIDVLSIQPGPEKGPGAGEGLEESVFNSSMFDRLTKLTGLPIFVIIKLVFILLNTL